jgi:3-phenylpropionate/cinnamic acid dioxygenase small subunit
MDMQDLIDERDIVAVGLRYARSIDRRDREGFLSCFAPDAEYGLDGNNVRGHERIGHTITRVERQFSATQHVTTNFEVTLDGDRATMRSCYFATHVWREAFADPHLVMGGVYDDVLARTPEGWRIAVRHLTNSWITGDPEAVVGIGLDYLLARTQSG